MQGYNLGYYRILKQTDDPCPRHPYEEICTLISTSERDALIDFAISDRNNIVKSSWILEQFATGLFMLGYDPYRNSHSELHAEFVT